MAHILVLVPRGTIHVMFECCYWPVAPCVLPPAGFLGHNKIRKHNTHSFSAQVKNFHFASYFKLRRTQSSWFAIISNYFVILNSLTYNAGRRNLPQTYMTFITRLWSYQYWCWTDNIKHTFDSSQSKCLLWSNDRVLRSQTNFLIWRIWGHTHTHLFWICTFTT